MEFQARFATEEACREYLFASRWPVRDRQPARLDLRPPAGRHGRARGAPAYEHRRRPQTSALPGVQLLPRAHRAISNFKVWMDGTHRGVSDQHVPVYLDEFVRHEALSDRVGCKTPPPGCRSSPAKLRAA